jgi:hypothetical protein
MRLPSIRFPRWAASSRAPVHVLLLGLGTLAVYAYGIGLLLGHKPTFDSWLREDQLVEWCTFGLLVALIARAAATHLLYRRSGGHRAAGVIWLVLALLLVFGALEEISYGQRIIGFKTPSFLLKNTSRAFDPFYNKQSELNVHNLIVLGVNVNRWVFGKLISAFLWGYFFAGPILYRRKRGFSRFIDRRGLPIIQNYQVIVYALVILPDLLFPGAGKMPELVEFGSSAVVLMVCLHPRNGAALETERRRIATATA